MRCPLPAFRTRIGGERNPTLPLGRRRRAASYRSLRVSRSIKRPLRTRQSSGAARSARSSSNRSFMMLTIEPTGAVLGATVRGVDLARSLDERDMGRILLALGRHGVLRFPDQHLDLASLKRFSEFFGEIQGNPIRDADPMREYPEIGILSNLKEGGKYIGSPDAGQDWHTDMTYREVPGFVNVLYGIRIPHRDGKPLGGTEFSNMHLAYGDLPSEIKSRLAQMTATHNFEKFWELSLPIMPSQGW